MFKYVFSLLVIIGCINAVISILSGAIAFHWIGRISSATKNASYLFGIASIFQMLMSFAIILSAIFFERISNESSKKFFLISGICFFSAICFFSGSLYWVSFNGSGFIAPLGALMAIAGFIMMSIGSLNPEILSKK